MESLGHQHRWTSASRSWAARRSSTSEPWPARSANHQLKISANCAARTHENDIRPIAEISQRTGLNNRSGDFHRLQSHTPLYRRLDRRFSAPHHRKGCQVRASRSGSIDVRHRGHHALRSGHREAPVLAAISCRRARHRDLRHGGHATPMGVFAPGAFCPRRKS